MSDRMRSDRSEGSISDLIFVIDEFDLFLFDECERDVLDELLVFIYFYLGKWRN